MGYTSEIITSIIAITAVVATVIIATVSNKNVKTQNEMQLRTMIFGVKKALNEVKYGAEKEGEKEKFYLRELAKSYEIACEQFKKGKLDKQYFKMAYLKEILEFVTENESVLYTDVVEYNFTLKTILEYKLEQTNNLKN